MIVLTDGKANPVPIDVAEQEAEVAKDHGVRVLTIGLGDPGDLDNDALARIASRPEYDFETPNAQELAGIYEAIAGLILCPPERFWGGRLMKEPDEGQVHS